jgi:hypothetical protein
MAAELAPKTTTYLAPHPFDAYGKPPTPGIPYESAGVVEDLEKWLEMQGDIDSFYREADDLEQEAQAARDKAEATQEKADELKAAILVVCPGWTEAMDDGDDPREAERC